jgi:hypothetical protein
VVTEPIGTPASVSSIVGLVVPRPRLIELLVPAPVLDVAFCEPVLAASAPPSLSASAAAPPPHAATSATVPAPNAASAARFRRAVGGRGAGRARSAASSGLRQNGQTDSLTRT